MDKFLLAKKSFLTKITLVTISAFLLLGTVSTVFAQSEDNEFSFPSCTNVLPTAGDIAHYTTGTHQIVGGPLLSGADDVYSLENGNFLQCFCPSEGNTGIQTNWLRTVEPIGGWFFENGEQWNLGEYNYAARNIEFSCTPNDPGSTPEPTPNCTGDTHLDAAGKNCVAFELGGPQVQSANIPQVLGASTMAGAGSFTETFYQAIMGLGGIFTIKGIKKIKKASKKA